MQSNETPRILFSTPAGLVVNISGSADQPSAIIDNDEKMFVTDSDFNTVEEEYKANKKNKFVLVELYFLSKILWKQTYVCKNLHISDYFHLNFNEYYCLVGVLRAATQ